CWDPPVGVGYTIITVLMAWMGAAWGGAKGPTPSGTFSDTVAGIWQGARTGTDRHGLARTGTDWHGLARTGTDWHGLARSGTDWRGLAEVWLGSQDGVWTEGGRCLNAG